MVTTTHCNAEKNQLRMYLVVILIIVLSLYLVTNAIIPIDRTSKQQQYAYAQKNTTLLPYNSTSINNTTFPLIHNYASSPPAPVNSWLIESKNGLVIVDTQRQFSEAKKLLKEVKDINKPILGLIFTHPHPDHINGAEALLNGTANVPIYSTQSTFNVMKNDIGGYIVLSKQLLPHSEYSNKVVLPNTIVRSGENITIDGITFHFEDLGIGEADDMMLIYLPLQKMLFTGDIVNNHMHPFFAGAVSPQGPSHIFEWIGQIEYLIHKYPVAKPLFPGHGLSGPAKTLLNDQLNYLNTFRSLVKEQILVKGKVRGEAAGVTIDDAGKVLIKNELQHLYPSYSPVATLPNMIDYNIDAIAKEMSQEKK